MERYIDGTKSKLISGIFNKVSTFVKSLNGLNQTLFNFMKILCTSLFVMFLGYFFSIELSLISEFVLLLIGTFVFYNVLYFILDKYVKSFREINPEHKKMYVVKNFTKSAMLANLCCLIPNHIWGVFSGNCDLYFMKQCAIHYVINDIVGLLVVKKLPTTTKIHHITTTIFAFLTLLKTNNTIDIITLIEVYAMFSALAFCVNFYLGFRVFPSNVLIKKNLSLLSFIVYVGTCCFNWIVQVFLVYQLFFISIWQVCIYIVFFFSVARDDVILMKWLYGDYTSMIKNN